MDLSRLLPVRWAALASGAVLRERCSPRLVSAVATLALVAGFAPRLAPRRAAGRRPPAGATAPATSSSTAPAVKALTEPARALLAGLPPGGPRLAALAAHLAADCPDAAGATSRRSSSTAPASATIARAATAPPSRSSASRAAAPPSLSIRAGERGGARAARDAEAALARAGGRARASCATCSTARR